MRTLTVAALLLALALAGCSSDDTNGTDSSTDGPMTTGMMDHTPKMHSVSLTGSQFVNASVEVYVGDKVMWTHADGTTAHTVTSDSGSAEAFDSHPNCAPAGGVGVPVGQVCMVDGGTFEHPFQNAGSFGYHCKVHSGMTGTVTVLEHPM